MTHLERFYATARRQPVDRPACWLGLPDPAALPALLKHFGAADMADLKRAVDDDIWPVEVPYHDGKGNALYMAFDFAKSGTQSTAERTLTTPGFFEDCEDIDEVDNFPWPDPAQFMNAEACRAAAMAVPDGYAGMAVMWAAHFQDACAAFGMENALMTMLTEPDVFKAVIDRITEFYLAAGEIFYKATEGLLHAVLIGNDLGSQTGLIISPDALREFVLPGTRRLIAQAKAHGLVVVHHSCGAVFDIIPDLIEAGADVIHPIQALASGMQPERLRDIYGGKVSFCGGVDAQELLVRGTPEDIVQNVRKLCDLFPTGLIVSPSHEAILPDAPPANIEAIFKTVHGL